MRKDPYNLFFFFSLPDMQPRSGRQTETPNSESAAILPSQVAHSLSEAMPTKSHFNKSPLFLNYVTRVLLLKGIDPPLTRRAESSQGSNKQKLLVNIKMSHYFTCDLFSLVARQNKNTSETCRVAEGLYGDRRGQASVLTPITRRAFLESDTNEIQMTKLIVFTLLRVGRTNFDLNLEDIPTSLYFGRKAGMDQSATYVDEQRLANMRAKITVSGGYKY